MILVALANPTVVDVSGVAQPVPTRCEHGALDFWSLETVPAPQPEAVDEERDDEERDDEESDDQESGDQESDDHGVLLRRDSRVAPAVGSAW